MLRSLLTESTKSLVKYKQTTIKEMFLMNCKKRNALRAAVVASKEEKREEEICISGFSTLSHFKTGSYFNRTASRNGVAVP